MPEPRTDADRHKQLAATIVQLVQAGGDVVTVATCIRRIDAESRIEEIEKLADLFDAADFPCGCRGGKRSRSGVHEDQCAIGWARKARERLTRRALELRSAA